MFEVEQCLSTVTHIINGEGELFTNKLILTDLRFMRAKGCYYFFL